MYVDAAAKQSVRPALDPFASGFRKNHHELTIAAVYLYGGRLDSEECALVARYGGRPGLHSELLGTLTAQPSGLVSILERPARALLALLHARAAALGE